VANLKKMLSAMWLCDCVYGRFISRN
jgi:hypothetical protein